MINKEDKVGLYVTLIVHLSIIIILLLAQIGATWQKETSFVLDFTKQEEVERQQREAEKMLEEIQRAQMLKESLQEKIDRQLGDLQTVKNVTTNKGALKDDRNTDIDKLMADAKRLEQELRNHKVSAPEVEEEAPVSGGEDKAEGKEKAYSGASVLSWQLDGRNAVKLPVPAYKCYGAGEVTVIITVDNAGKVIAATVQGAPADKCLINAAITAAKNSRFSAKRDGPGKQTGDITYLFIAQ